MAIQQMLLGIPSAVAPSFVNGSVAFNGTDDNLTIDASSDWDIGTGDFTIECWVYPRSYELAGGWYKRIWSMSSNPSAGNPSDGIAFEMQDNGRFHFRINDSAFISSSNTFAEHYWYHTAFLRISGTYYIYINGSLEGSSTANGGTALNYGSHTLKIGEHHGINNSSWNGRISNFHLVKGEGLYSNAFTPSMDPVEKGSNTKVLCCQDKDDVTQEQCGKTITANGFTYAVGTDPFEHGAVQFNGSSYLEIADNEDWNFGGGEFTVECWYYPTSHGSYEGLVHQWPNGNYNTTNGWTLEPVGGNLDFYYCRTTNDLDSAHSGQQLSLNEWHHCAAVRKGNEIRVYVDGVAGSTKSFAGNIQNGTGPVRIGGGCAGAGNVNGYISNVRVTKGESLYWSNFTPSDAPLSLESQSATKDKVKLLCCQNKTDVILAKKTPSSISKSGSPARSHWDPCSDTYSAWFGTSNNRYMYVDDGSIFNYGAYGSSTYNFCFEAWVYIPDLGGGHGDNKIFSKWQSGNYSIQCSVKGNGTLGFTGGENSGGMDVFESWTSGPLVKKNEWTHVAFCRNGNAYILFWINGQIANNTSSWGSYTYNRSFSGSQRMCFGRNMDGTSYNMHGNISNARVHIGEQVYSSNFTPLKEPLTSSNSNGNASKCVYLGLQKRIPTESTIGPNLYQGDNGAQTSYDHPF